MGILDYYLIIINVIGFVAYLINMRLYNTTPDKEIDSALTIISLLGGSGGIILAILIFDRESVKDNMMSRVFVACTFVIQIVLVLIIKGYIAEDITLAFWEFFNNHIVLMIYLIVINFVTLIAFAYDKIAAVENKSRIRILTLLGLSFIGGSIGALLAMYIFRHKTKKDYFTVGVPLTILMQVVVIFFLMNMEF